LVVNGVRTPRDAKDAGKQDKASGCPAPILGELPAPLFASCCLVILGFDQPIPTNLFFGPSAFGLSRSQLTPSVPLPSLY
jgi:hypothetical protein